MELVLKLETEKERQAFFAIVDAALKAKGLEIYESVVLVQSRIIQQAS